MHYFGIILVFFISIVISSFLTLVEFSLLRLKKTRIKEIIEHKTNEDWLQTWLKRAEMFWLTSLVIGTTARLTAGITLYALILFNLHHSPWYAILLSIALTSIAVVILTEIIPRAIGRAFGDKFAHRLLTPMQIFSWVVFPLTFPFMVLIKTAGRYISIKESLNPVADFENDILEILEAGEKAEELEEDEKELISSVVEFTETIVREVMVPRVDIVAVDISCKLDEIHRKIMQTNHTRIPVYDGNIDNIVGVFYAKDLLKYVNLGGLENRAVADEMHEPIFVPETKNINDLLQEFQQKKINVAIVVDEFGGTAGLVTIKDLLEEIVGEMKDEDDREKPGYSAMPDGAYIIDAKMPISEIAHQLDIMIPESPDYDTIGGYIYTVIGRIPHKDEVFQQDDVIIKILEVDDRRIYKVVLRKAEKRVGKK